MHLITPALAQAEQIAKGTEIAGNAAAVITTQGGILGAVAILVSLAAGLAIVILGLVIRTLWNTIKERDAIIATLQERRSDDTGEQAKKLGEISVGSANAITQNVGATAELSGRVQKILELLVSLPDVLQRILLALDRNADKIDGVRQSVDTGRRS